MNKKVLALGFVAALLCSASAMAATVETPAGVAGEKAEISVLLPGNAKDNGFMEAGYRGYKRIAEQLSG